MVLYLSLFSRRGVGTKDAAGDVDLEDRRKLYPILTSFKFRSAICYHPKYPEWFNFGHTVKGKEESIYIFVYKKSIRDYTTVMDITELGATGPLER